MKKELKSGILPRPINRPTVGRLSAGLMLSRFYRPIKIQKSYQPTVFFNVIAAYNAPHIVKNQYLQSKIKMIKSQKLDIFKRYQSH